MTTAGLQKKIAGVLGVSSSEKELAFEIFILKVGEILTEDVTLKVQRIGFFQLKKNTGANTSTLLFIPLSEDLYRESKNLFLTIQLPSHHNKEHDLDPDVFSIGVGKPILPLSGSNTNDTETSYAILRKSIEERVNEILAGSDQLPNFSIWDDYYKSVKYVVHPAKDSVNDFTADSEFKEEFMAEGLTKNLLELSSGTGDEDIDKNDSEHHNISLKELLDGFNVDDELHEEISYGEEPESVSTILESDGEIFNNEVENNLEKDDKDVNEHGEEDDLENALQKVIDEVENNLENDDKDVNEHFSEENVIEENGETEDSKNDKINAVEDDSDKMSEHFTGQIEGEDTVDVNSEMAGHEWDAINEIADNLRNIDETLDAQINTDDREETNIDVDDKINDDFNNTDEDFTNEVHEENINEEEKERTEDQNLDEINEIIAGLAAEQDEQKKEPEESFIETEEQPDDSLEIEVPTQKKENFYEIKHESKLEEVDLEKANEDDVEPIYYLGLKRKEDEPIEWDWGDELKEEFGVEFLKDELSQPAGEFEENPHQNDQTDEVEETIDDIFKTTRPTSQNLFEELETTVKKEIEETKEFENLIEIEETEEQHQVLEYSGEPRRYHFVEEEELESGNVNVTNNYPTGTRFESTDEIMEEYNNQKGFSFGKSFLIIFSSFIVVVALIVYLLMNGGNEQPKVKTPLKAETDSFSLQQPVLSDKIDSSQIYSDEFSEFPRVASLPAKNGSSNLKPATNQNAADQQTTAAKPDSKNSSLYRVLVTDTRINKNIYFDGKEYNFQVSSWRINIKAEQEVQRLRSKGYNAFVTKAYLPQKGGTWFRVRIGSFKSKEEAEQFSTNNTF